MKLGRVGEIELEEARKRCRKARGDAQDGIDPTSDDRTKSEHFKPSVEDYIKHEQIGRHANKSAEATQAVMLRDTKDWHDRPVATIRYSEVERLLWLIRDGDKDKELKPRPYLANRLYSHLKDFFAWNVRRHKIKQSPMAGMEKPWEGAKSRERSWFKKQAADKAIKALWQAADNDAFASNEKAYVKLMILTGKRRSALASMAWEQIEPDWFWDAPASNSKNKRLHGVPLSQFAQRILGQRQSQGKVFGELGAFDRLQAKVRQESGIDDFFWHGIRHLCETKTAELRDAHERPAILPHVRDLLFDHVPQRGAGAGYDHHDYKPEMRAALEAWSNYVEGLATPPGVKRLRG